jgi:hypothetical protein
MACGENIPNGKIPTANFRHKFAIDLKHRSFMSSSYSFAISVACIVGKGLMHDGSLFIA